MDEFIKKLIERLKESDKRELFKYREEGATYLIPVSEVKSIVNQLAEEYADCYKDCGNCEAYDKEKHLCPKFCMVIKDALAEMEENRGGWILCSDRLPESGVEVIVSYKDRFLTQADGTCDGWYDEPNKMWHLNDYEYSDNAKVIDWRERLAPYQPKGE